MDLFTSCREGQWKKTLVARGHLQEGGAPRVGDTFVCALIVAVDHKDGVYCEKCSCIWNEACLAPSEDVSPSERQKRLILYFSSLFVL